MIVFKEFTFDSAHYLPLVPTGHKCKNLHGHTYKLTVFVEGPVNEQGWVIDYADLAKALDPTLLVLDHHCLNVIRELENSTCENLSRFIWQRLSAALPEGVSLNEIRVQETATSGVIYRGD